MVVLRCCHYASQGTQAGYGVHKSYIVNQKRKIWFPSSSYRMHTFSNSIQKYDEVGRTLHHLYRTVSIQCLHQNILVMTQIYGQSGGICTHILLGRV
jgi:hypothetical protein